MPIHLFLPYAMGLVVALLVVPGFIKTRKPASAWCAAYFLGIVFAVFGLLYGAYMMHYLSTSTGPSFPRYLVKSFLVVMRRFPHPGTLAVMEPFLLIIGNAVAIPAFILSIRRVLNPQD